MKIAIYSLTRDRLWSTMPCFTSLREKAGEPFFHVVVDNGSADGTLDWLLNEFKPDRTIKLAENAGISRASNLALEEIFRAVPDVDTIIKADNDCMVVSEDILTHLIKVSEELMRPFASLWVLSPSVSGINRQPKRNRKFWTPSYEVGETGIVGGLFHVVPAYIYRRYRYPENLPLARGQDDHFCQTVKDFGARIGYIENLHVEHHLTTDGQCGKDRPYFERKWAEEKTVIA